MNRYQQRFHVAMAAVLLAYIAAVGAFNIMLPDKAFSESENRVLEQAPRFSLDKLLEGKFTSDYEKYLADQFAWRDFWIGVKSDVERAAGKRESNGVYLGKDGYLLQEFHQPDRQSIQDKAEAINAFAASAPDLHKYFMLAPGAVKILEDKLPPCAPVDDQLISINKFRDSLDRSIKYVDVNEVLSGHKNEQIFYKTDHHWTTKGAYYAYEELGRAMGFTPHAQNYFEIKRVTASFYGAIYSKGGFRHLQPDAIELYLPKEDERCRVEYRDENKTRDSLYVWENLNKKDKYTVFLGGNQSLIKITTNAQNEKSLLVIKDSFANCLIPFLAGHYRHIYVVDLRYFTDDLQNLIKSDGIGDLLILYNANTFFEDTSIERISE